MLNTARIAISCSIILILFSIADANKSKISQYRLGCNIDEWIKKVEKSKNKIIASSEMDSEGIYSYKVDNLVDGRLDNCWIPKTVNNESGINEFIIMKIPYKSKGFRVINGLAKNINSFYNNNRVKKMYIGFISNFDYKGYGGCPNPHKFTISYQTTINDLITLKDTFKPQEIIFNNSLIDFSWDEIFDLKYGKDIYLIVSVWSIYKGLKYNDTCITEIKIIK